MSLLDKYKNLTSKPNERELYKIKKNEASKMIAPTFAK